MHYLKKDNELEKNYNPKNLLALKPSKIVGKDNSKNNNIIIIFFLIL